MIYYVLYILVNIDEDQMKLVQILPSRKNKSALRKIELQENSCNQL